MTSTNAGWHNDPTGRHELRWFDGTSWTDNVSDGGVQTVNPLTDSGSNDIPTVGASGTKSAADARDSAPEPSLTASDSQATAARPPWVLWAIGAVVLVTIALAAFVLTRSTNNDTADPPPAPTAAPLDESTATGDDIDVTASLERGAFGQHAIVLQAGDVVRFRAEPSSNRSDLVVALGLAPDDAKQGVVDFFATIRGTNLFDDLAGPAQSVPATTDEVTDTHLVNIFADFTLAPRATLTRPQLVPFADAATGGGAEADWAIIPASGTYVVYVYDFNGADGSYRLMVEVGDPIDLTRNDAFEQLGVGAFFDDNDFYTADVSGLELPREPDDSPSPPADDEGTDDEAPIAGEDEGGDDG